ncbi:MAG TPA: aminotransferase class V-fold PLP-dependent enzyme [Spirochaetota bacterium]|nr:aminotransferase class V-fold PLP-dependent enzyme [Spirochaetota bacterium]HPH02984.1 aminotransferase class V-fold PLP-dependent enzyme [Spirochaetota bacterium]
MSFPGIGAVRAGFPCLATPGRIWLDSAATSLKLKTVIETVSGYYSGWCGTVGRSSHAAAEEASHAVQEVRRVMARYLGVEDPAGIIFVPGTTGGINLLARAWNSGRIVTSRLEHHSNLLPWHDAARRNAAEIESVGLDSRGGIDMEALERALRRPAGLVALSMRSNVTGAVLDCRRAADLAHRAGAVLFVDAAQEAARGPMNLLNDGVDAASFSSHKMHGPTGSGVLWVRPDLLERLDRVESGGGMALQVDDDEMVVRIGHARFEAGTPHIAGILGMGSAARWLMAIGRETITEYEDGLGAYLHQELARLDGVRIFSCGGGILSCTITGWHPHDAADQLDQRGFAVRAGTLCAQPCLRALGVDSLLRASLAIHSTCEECQAFADAVRDLILQGGFR